MQNQDFALAFEKISEIASQGNQYLAKHEFWNLVKPDDPTSNQELSNIDLLEELLFINFELLRILSVLLTPYCPETASSMLSIVRKDDHSEDLRFDLEREFDVAEII